MTMIPTVSAASFFDTVRTDGQATDNLQDSAINDDDGLAQGNFFPMLASAMNGVLQQPLAEHPNQADANDQSCEDLPSIHSDMSAADGAQGVDIGSTLSIEPNKIQASMNEGLRDMVVPATSTDDSHHLSLFPSVVATPLLQTEMVASLGQRLSISMQSIQANENTPLNQERESFSPTAATSTPQAKPDRGEIQPTVGERLQTILPSRALLDVLDVQATPIEVHEGVGTSQMPGEPLRTIPSAAKPTDARADSNLPFIQIERNDRQILRPSAGARSLGIGPPVEKSNPFPQEIASEREPNEPIQSRPSDRLAPGTDGAVSNRGADTHAVQQSVRGIFTPMLSTVSSSAILGNGERAFLYQVGREVTNGGERLNSSEPPKGTRTTAHAETLEVRESEGLPEPQRMIDADQTAIPIADKPATQVEKSPTRGQKDVTKSDASSDALGSSGNKVMPPTVGQEANAKNSNSSEPDGTEASKQSSLRSKEKVAATEGTEEGRTTVRDRIEKASGSVRQPSVEPESTSTASDAIAADSSLRASENRTVESASARGHSLPGIQTMNAPANVGTKPTGFMSQELGFDARTISSLVTEHMTKGISNELVQRLRDGVSELKLQLKPESLGEMTLSVRLDDEKVVAQIRVTQPDVKLALEATVPQLRDALASRGIEVQRVDILAAGDAPTRESRGQQEARQRLSARRRGGDVAEERYKGARSLGYNTIEVVM